MYIYKIINTTNGKVYVGQTLKRGNLRFNNHRYDLNHNKHHSEHLQRAWNKYGEENFKVELIESILDKSIIDDFVYLKENNGN